MIFTANFISILERDSITVSISTTIPYGPLSEL